MEVEDRSAQILDAELWPHPVGEPQLRERAFPEQEVGEPLLAARADQQVHVCGSAIAGGRLSDQSTEMIERRWTLHRAPSRGTRDRFTGGIIEGDAQMEAMA